MSKPARSRVAYLAMSALLAWHTFAMVVAPTPDSAIADFARSLVQPYLTLLRLDNGWGFFAPNVHTGYQYSYVVESAAGTTHIFFPADQYSRFHPSSIWERDRHTKIMASPELFGDAAVAALCEEHASLDPVSVTLREGEQKPFWPDDQLSGKHALDPEFVKLRTLKTVRCPGK